MVERNPADRRTAASGGLNLKPALQYISGRVSVIIPTYNYGKFIPRAIQSVLDQPVSDLEVIVVDDGSSDGTADILSPFDRKIKYIYQENAGLSAARNKGIANSTGEFIQFLDADDMLGQATIALQMSYLQSRPEIQVAVCRNKLFEDTTFEGNPILFGSWKLACANLDVHLCHFNIAPPHAFLFRRKAILETGGFDTDLKACEDYDFWLRAAVKGFVPHYNAAGLVYYRRHQKSMSADLSRQVLYDYVIHKKLNELLEEYPEFPVHRRFEGLLAFSSGALLTATRLHGYKPEKAHTLLRLILERTQDASNIARSETNEWNILAILYYFRAFSFLILPCFADCGIAGAIKDNLKEILGTKKPTGLFGDTLLASLSGRREYMWERYHLRRLPLTYFRNRCFPPGVNCSGSRIIA